MLVQGGAAAAAPPVIKAAVGAWFASCRRPFAGKVAES
jgi:hypothetical protein